jgi:hypothetical protein
MNPNTLDAVPDLGEDSVIVFQFASSPSDPKCLEIPKPGIRRRPSGGLLFHDCSQLTGWS